MPWTIARARGENRPSFFPRSGPAPSHKGSSSPGAAMTRHRPILLLLSLLPVVSLAAAASAVSGCATERKPLTGFVLPPPGTLVLDSNPGGTVLVWPIFDLPSATQIFRPRLNGQDAVVVTSQEGFYDYANWQMQGWTGGWD